MKKVLSVLVLVLFTVQFAVAGDVVTQDVKQLPQAARTFLEKYFPNSQVSYIKIETEFISKKYEVLMTDRTEVEFDGKGNWIEVNCRRTAVPAVLVPAYVQEAVERSFAGEIITKIERERGNVEVKLSNGYSMEFNKRGQLIDIDD